MPTSPPWNSNWHPTTSRESLRTCTSARTLGKAYEDKGDFDTAGHYYDSGNQRQRKRVAHDPVQFEVRPKEIQERITSKEFLDRGMPAPATRPRDPIFIVGLPAPMTLIEQILRHSQPGRRHRRAPGTGSAGRLRSVVIDPTMGGDYPESVRDLQSKDFRGYGKQYIEETLHPAVDRQTVLYRQAAEQLFTCRVRSPDPAERKDHQCAAPSVRQLSRRVQQLGMGGDRTSPTISPSSRCITASITRSCSIPARRASGQSARRALPEKRLIRPLEPFARGSSREHLLPAVRGILHPLPRDTTGQSEPRERSQYGNLSTPARWATGVTTTSICRSGATASATSSTRCQQSSATRAGGVAAPRFSRRARPRGRGWHCARPS